MLRAGSGRRAAVRARGRLPGARGRPAGRRRSPGAAARTRRADGAGHGEAAASGRLTTGVLKAVGALGTGAVSCCRGAGPLGRRVPAGGGVLVLATNVFNLLDLRPGRALKVFVAARRRPDARGVGHRCAARARHLARRGCWRWRRTTSASGRCSATPARTWSAPSPASGWSHARPDGRGDRARCARCRHGIRRVSLDLRAGRKEPSASSSRLTRQASLSDDPLHLRDRWSRVIAREGHRRRLDRPASGEPRAARPDPEVRPVHQRRSGHDEPVPARRGVRHRGRRRDRPRPRPLRALHGREHLPRPRT